MAKAVQTADKPQAPQTPVFKLEADGDAIKGEVVGLGLFKGQYGDVPVLTIQTADGPFRVYGRGTMIDRLYDLKPNVGNIIEIIRVGERESAGGNKYIKYKVTLLPW